MHRTLMAKCLTFVITLAVAIFILPSKLILAAAIIILAAAILLFVLSCFKKNLKIYFSMAVFALLAFTILFLHNKTLVEPIDKLKGTTADITATVNSAEISSNGNTYYIVKLNSVNSQKLGSGAKIRLHCSNYEKLNDYDEISAKVSFFKSDLLSSSDLYYLSSNISGTAISAGDITVTNSDSFSLLREICKIRDKMVFNVRSIINSEEGEIISGILLGKRDYISNETSQLFSDAGISHLLCVSGLHLSILSSIINYALFLLLFLGKKTRTAFTYIFIAIFVVMIGFTPSIVRSAIMTILILLSQCIHKDYDAPTAIAFSAFLICLFNPYAISNIGFLLSFSATIGLTISNAIIFNLRRKFSLKTVNPFFLIFFEILRLILPCFFAFLFTIPISVCVFKTLSVYSPIINLIISPLLSPLLAFSLFGAIFTFIPIPFISQSLLFVASKLTACIVWVAETFSSLPYSQIRIENDLTIPITVLIVIIFSVITLMRNRARKYVLAVLLCVPIICTSIILQHYTYKDTTQISLAAGDTCAVIIETQNNTFVSGFAKDNSYQISRLTNKNLRLLCAENGSAKDMTALSTFTQNKSIDTISIPKEFAASLTTLNTQKKFNAYSSENFKASFTDTEIISNKVGKNSLVLYNLNGFKIAHLTINSAENLPDKFNCDLLIANSKALPFLENYKAKYFILSETLENSEFLSKSLSSKGIRYVGDASSQTLFLKDGKLYNKAVFYKNAL